MRVLLLAGALLLTEACASKPCLQNNPCDTLAFKYAMQDRNTYMMAAARGSQMTYLEYKQESDYEIEKLCAQYKK